MVQYFLINILKYYTKIMLYFLKMALDGKNIANGLAVVGDFFFIVNTVVIGRLSLSEIH